MITVMTIVTIFMMNVKRRYLAITDSVHRSSLSVFLWSSLAVSVLSVADGGADVIVKRVRSSDVIGNCADRRYLAMRGMLTEVGGRIFETSRRKTTRARRIEIKKTN